MKATTGILVFACLWIMAAASVDIDHYYCTKFGDVSVYGQFYTTETAAPEPSKNALNLLFSSFDDVTGIDAEDIYSYDKGFIYPPSTSCGIDKCLMSYNYSTTESMVSILNNMTVGKKIGFTGMPVVLERPVAGSAFSCESTKTIPEDGFSRIALKIFMSCNRKNKHAEWSDLVKCEIDLDTDYLTKKWPQEGEVFQQTLEFVITSGASSTPVFFFLLFALTFLLF